MFNRIFIKMLSGAAVLLGLTSCGSGLLTQLSDIESYIQERPDSALAELRKIDTCRINSKQERALHSLLMAMALDKNCIDTSDMSVIEPALKWFCKHDEGEHGPASYFYAGRICFNAGDYPKAILNFQNARETASSVYWKGMAANHMGYTYNKCYNEKEELNCGLEALGYWLEYGDSTKIRQTYSSLAAAFHNNRLADKADSLLSILCDAEEPYYPAFIQKAEYRIKGPSPDYDEIVGLFETGIRNGASMTVERWYEYAFALFKTGRQALSQNILDQLSSQQESTAACLWLGKIAKDRGDFEKALEYEERWKVLSDKIVRDQLSQSLFKAQADCYRMESEVAESRLESTRLIASLLAILAVALILMSFVLFRSIKMRHEMEIARISAIADKASEMLSLAKKDAEVTESKNIRMEHQLEDLRRDFIQLYRTQFREIGYLVENESHDRGLSLNTIGRFNKKYSEILKEISSGESGQALFESRINESLDNVMEKLRSDFPEFKESDFRFLSFVIAGFDATTRSILLNDSPNNMRVKKSRLIKKILDSATENSPLYSSLLE